MCSSDLVGFAITEEFGREAHVVMGAAIDEALQGQVEICVIGTTDLGSRNFVRRPTTPPIRKGTEKSAAVSTSSGSAESQTAVKTASTASTRETAAAKAEAEKAKQEEFGFQGEPVENRGSFDKSDRNLFEGQDLDIPTYLRKGIKITV